MPSPFRLYSTLSRRVESFVPRTPGEVSIYVCGMTVYDHAHVGHARAFVVFDVVVRHLRNSGWNTRYVRNYTDVDDKIIRRASRDGEDPLTLAERYIASFREDMAGLGNLPPDVEPRVTASIPEIIAMIGSLVAGGHAYEDGGSVWFSVPSFPAYGGLSGQKVDDLRSDDSGTKRHPADFALWKAHREGEPSWDSPWGPGRPGWHIECSAMADRWLGHGFDLHGGGLDLVFPHHENEVAQSECSGHHGPFARYWLHNGLLTVAGGQKMGHSLGNFVTIRDLLPQFPAEALRLYYLQSHYRSPLPWSDTAIPEALGMLARLYEAREQAESLEGTGQADAVAASLGADALTVLDLGRAFEERFRAAMDDDFNTSLALAHAFELARAINRLAANKKVARKARLVVEPALAAFRLLADTFGVCAMTPQAFQADVKARRSAAMGIDPAWVDAQLAARAEARASKEWALADQIRAELDAAGVVIMDGAAGSEWRLRLVSPT
jgi:cysteinyl-tRNA synthetase